MATNLAPTIDYSSRDFTALRQSLINYCQTYHADIFKYLNDASADMMYLEMLSYVGDTLSYSTDKAFNESFRTTAQARESLVRIANDFGFTKFGPKPSSTQAQVSIRVPYIGTASNNTIRPNPDLLVSIQPGMKLKSDTGVIFEVTEEVNFANADRRIIIPNFDANNVIIDYTIYKGCTIIAGETKTQRFYVSSDNIQPFLNITLDDLEITQIISAVSVQGNTYTVPDDSLFRDYNSAWLEVDNLVQDKIFVPLNPLPQELQGLMNLYSDVNMNYGEWINKPKRFIVRRDKNNLVTLTFGNSVTDYTNWDWVVNNQFIGGLFSLTGILNNMVMGEMPGVNTTLFIKYRTGAGVATNTSTGQTYEITDKTFYPSTGSVSISDLQNVRNSLTISVNMPAVGGTDILSNEEIRQHAGAVFAAGDRGVTYEDVKALINQMPTEYGQPFRISYEEIPPMLTNYSQVVNGVNSLVTELLAETTAINRNLKAQQINQFLSSLQNGIAYVPLTTNVPVTLSSYSNDLLANTQSLWIGEKCRLHVLTVNKDYQPQVMFKDANGIWQSPAALLKQNMKNWLLTKRIIGDWVDIVDARVVNFKVVFTIIADTKNKTKVLIDCLNKLRDYFNPLNWQINQPIYISNVYTILQEIEGVVNVVDIKFINVFGTDQTNGKIYSPIEIGRYRNNSNISLNSFNNEFEMNTVNNVILSYPDTFLSVLFPESDIQGNVL